MQLSTVRGPEAARRGHLKTETSGRRSGAGSPQATCIVARRRKSFPLASDGPRNVPARRRMPADGLPRCVSRVHATCPIRRRRLLSDDRGRSTRWGVAAVRATAGHRSERVTSRSKWRPGPRTGHQRRRRSGSRGQPVIGCRRSAGTATTVSTASKLAMRVRLPSPLCGLRCWSGAPPADPVCGACRSVLSWT
jgi:hypothetical protein